MISNIYRGLFNRFSNIRWKLALSYTFVTIAALVVMEVIVIVAFSSYIANAAKTTPSELLSDIQNGSYLRLGSNFLSESPPDVAGLKDLIGQISWNTVDVKPIQIGDLVFDVSSTKILYVIYTDARGALIDTLPHDFMENTQIGERLDVNEIPGLKGPFEAALAGEIESDKLIKQISDNTLVGAIPIFHNKYSGRVVGVLAFLHQSRFQEIINLPFIVRYIGISLLVFTVLAGGLGAIFGSITARGLVVRLDRLARSAYAWSRGNFSVFVNDASSDEIGGLARVLNNMAIQLDNLLEERQAMSALEERKGLARELHDSVKQQAFAASAQLGAVRAHLNNDLSKAETNLTEAERLVYEVRQELNDLIQELHPVTLQGRGLVNEVREYAEDCSKQSGIDITVLVQGERSIPFEIEQTLFRIIQTSLANVVRHSKAEHSEIKLNYYDHRVKLSVTDDGVGFDPDTNKYGLGLRSMRERAESIDADLRISSQIDAGTKIEVECVYHD